MMKAIINQVSKLLYWIAFKDYLAIVWDNHTGCINHKNIYLHSEEFETFQKQNKVRMITFEEDTDWGDVLIGKTRKDWNGLWHYQYKNRNNRISVETSLNEKIINLDVIMYYYKAILWHSRLPAPLEVVKTDLFRTNILTAFSSVEYFDVVQLNRIIDEYRSTTPDARIIFVGKGEHFSQIENMQDKDFVHITKDSCHPHISYRRIDFFVESTSYLDRMRLYRLNNLLNSSGWNDQNHRFRKFIEANRGSLFALSEMHPC